MLIQIILQPCHCLLNIKQSILDPYCCILSMKEGNAMISRGIPCDHHNQDGSKVTWYVSTLMSPAKVAQSHMTVK